MVYTTDMEWCITQTWNGIYHKHGMIYTTDMKWCITQTWNGV